MFRREKLRVLVVVMVKNTEDMVRYPGGIFGYMKRGGLMRDHENYEER